MSERRDENHRLKNRDPKRWLRILANQPLSGDLRTRRIVRKKRKIAKTGVLRASAAHLLAGIDGSAENVENNGSLLVSPFLLE